MTTYHHSQFGWAIVCPVILIAIAAGIVAAFSSEQSGIGVAIILLICTALFYKMTIEIDEHFVRAKFGAGLTFRRIRLADIAACEPIRIRWWYGWGIHLTPYGWLYNVSGWDAVAITLRNGRQVSLGTDQPNELCTAIRRSASAK